MKFGLFVFVLAVLASNIAVSFGEPLVVGDCEIDDIPDASREKCKLIHCTKNELGVISVTEAECGLSKVPQCAGGRLTLVNDPKKVYPRCCYRAVCY